MAIKALKQNVSICEIQKMIHQWKNRGINDPTVTKLLDLHLGMPAYMNESGIYPLCNFYYIRIALKFSYTTALITAVTDCHTFGLIWDEGHTKIIAFYSPLWYHKSDKETKNVQQDSAQKTPQDSAQDSAFFNSNILYNIIIYILRRIPIRDYLAKISSKSSQIFLLKILPERLTAMKLQKLLHLPKSSFTSSTPLPKRSRQYWCRLSTVSLPVTATPDRAHWMRWSFW